MLSYIDSQLALQRIKNDKYCRGRIPLPMLESEIVDLYNIENL
jgi:hypothetical protein